MKVCYFGTYEREYPRNAIFIRGLRTNGVEVEECHVAVWKGIADKNQLLRRLGSVTKLAWRFLTAYVRLAYRYRKLPHQDAIVVGVLGHLDVLVARLLALRARTPVIFNPLISLYDTAVADRRLFSPRSLPSRILWTMDWCACHLADVVLVDTDEQRDYFLREFSLAEEKVCAIPVGGDDTLFSPQPATGGGGFEVLFFGKFIPLHGVRYIVEAAKLLASDEGVRFTLIGIGQERPAMEELARKWNLGNVRFIDWVEYEELPQYIAGADLCLGIFDPGDKASRVIPNKVYQAMAMGKAVVTGDSPAARKMLGDAVLLCRRGSGEALATAIGAVKNNPGLRAELGRKSYELFRHHFCLDRVGAQLKGILTALLVPKPP